MFLYKSGQRTNKPWRKIYLRYREMIESCFIQNVCPLKNGPWSTYFSFSSSSSSSFFPPRRITPPGGINFPSRPRQVDVKGEFRWVELTVLRSPVKASYISLVSARDHEKLFFVIVRILVRNRDTFTRGVSIPNTPKNGRTNARASCPIQINYFADWSYWKANLMLFSSLAFIFTSLLYNFDFVSLFNLISI